MHIVATREEKRSLLPQPVPFSMENVKVTSLDLDLHLDGWPLEIITFQEEQKTGWSLEF